MTLYIGIRDDAVERVVSELCGVNDGYRQYTASVGIGYLLADRRWREWEITPENAEDVARELAGLVQSHAAPHLRRLASDAAEMLRAAKDSPAYSQAVGGCRVAVLLARCSGRDAAVAFVADRVNELRARSDAAADEERRVAERAHDWLLAL